MQGLKSLLNYQERKMHNKIVLLPTPKLDTSEVSISEALINLYINHDKFVSVNNVMGKYNEIKEKVKNPGNDVEYTT